jgi:DNA-binding NtrC family response regulator
LEDAGYTVEAVGTCAAAAEKLDERPTDFAIIDLNLPDGLGLDLAVKAKAKCPGLVILLLTGEGHVELGPAQSAIHTVLTKPVSPSQLIDIIHKIVDS